MYVRPVSYLLIDLMHRWDPSLRACKDWGRRVHGTKGGRLDKGNEGTGSKNFRVPHAGQHQGQCWAVDTQPSNSSVDNVALRVYLLVSSD